MSKQQETWPASACSLAHFVPPGTGAAVIRGAVNLPQMKAEKWPLPSPLLSEEHQKLGLSAEVLRKGAGPSLPGREQPKEKDRWRVQVSNPWLGLAVSP